MEQVPPSDFDITTVTLRTASDGDLSALRNLYEGGFSVELPENDTGADIENIHEAYYADEGLSGFWIADLGGEVLGMVGVLRHDDNVAEIRRLRVHQDYRRRGVGSLLMEQAITFCRDMGYLKVILDVRIERDPAIRMFEKLGFQLGRTREISGRKLIDFYIDMYRDPHR